MSRVEWDATEARFKAAMEKMELVIGEYASFQKALDEEENFLAKRRKRLRHARAFFASISQAVSETRKDLENLRYLAYKSFFRMFDADRLWPKSINNDISKCIYFVLVDTN